MQPTTETAPLLLDTRHVAARLHIHFHQAQRMMREGELPILMLGKRRRVPLLALEQWIAERTRPPAK